MRTADRGVHKATTHLTNILLAFQLLRRRGTGARRDTRIVEAGLASAHALRRLFRPTGGRPAGGAASKSARTGAG